jgi:hypothetical protein
MQAAFSRLKGTVRETCTTESGKAVCQNVLVAKERVTEGVDKW